MPAYINMEPPNRAFSDNEIWSQIATDAIGANHSKVQIQISGAGPTVGQTFKLDWPGGTITYTVAAAADYTGLKWPVKGSETLAEYADRIAEFLREKETVTQVFDINRTGFSGSAELIEIKRKVSEIFQISVTEGMSNVAASVVNVASSSQVAPDNLRSLVEVWADTGSFNNDYILDRQHAPYDWSNSVALFDLHTAFGHLQPYLPDTNNINPYPPAGGLSIEDAYTAYQQYYIRYADKYGTPAVADALFRSESSYLAILGGMSGDLGGPGPSIPFGHNYRRRDGVVFIKPCTETQPDWVYPFFTTDTSIYVSILIRWSDGTTSTYTPWGTSGIGVYKDKIYCIPSGYNQMKLNTAAPPGGTAADAYIVGYVWRLGPPDGDGNWQYSLEYRVYGDTPWTFYLLFSNGVGGCETALLRGKKTESYEPSGEEYRIPRRFDVDRVGKEAQVGDFGKYNQVARTSWKANTGWYNDPYYIEHLKQLPLADAWLVDVEGQQFLKVIVQPKTMDSVRVDDETLFSMEFEIKSGWEDHNFNIK